MRLQLKQWAIEGDTQAAASAVLSMRTTAASLIYAFAPDPPPLRRRSFRAVCERRGHRAFRVFFMRYAYGMVVHVVRDVLSESELCLCFAAFKHRA